MAIVALMGYFVSGIGADAPYYAVSAGESGGGYALRKQPATVVIDAGHGGVDGGASAPSGRLESAYNLEIALRTELFLRFLGMPTVMTRTDDTSLHDPDALTLRAKKQTDLRNRAALANSVPNAVMLSIHQNKFTDSRYYGAQVFSNKRPESVALAKHIQDSLRLRIDPENRREPKTLDVILLSETDIPGALVECGFLSNAAEEAKLRDAEYQTKLAAVLSITMTEWVIMTENETKQ
jgi:N-acetylmuramoyl-L-alanine amidase